MMAKLPGRVKFTWEQRYLGHGYILWHKKWSYEMGKFAGKDCFIVDLYTGSIDARKRRISRYLKKRAKQ